jgi:hydrogenase/urease accessory protein HupE
MRAAALAAALLLPATAASAHVVIPGVGGFPGGLAHPLLVLSHALSLVALGLLVSRQPMRARLILIAAFMAAMAMSFGGVSLAYSTDRAELVVLALAAIAGLILASGWNAPLAVTALIAICLGGAILFDSVPAVPSIRETLLALAGTTLVATAAIGTIAFVSACLPAFWQRIGIRVAGSWIAASTILVLALRLAKL